MGDAPGNNPKIGAGHLAGMARQGLRELRSAMYDGSNVAQPPDLGIYGNATPGEVADARRPDAIETPDATVRDPPEPSVGGSVLADRLRQAESRQPPAADRGGKEVDRG